MKNLTPFPIVKKGKGALIYLNDGRILIDSISSWWSVIHGYNHPELNAEIKKQTNKIAHVMLGGLTHEPAIKLAEKLIQITPKSLNHVFFSDSGSVAVEVSLKMAVQYWVNLGLPEKNKFLSLKNGYHGDTFKAMEISDDSDFVKAFDRVLSKNLFLSPPNESFNQKNIDAEIEILEDTLSKNHHEIAAFILEPIVQCAGGFKIYSPLYLKAVKKLCNQYNVLLIFDEVATGFGRTGKLFAMQHAKVSPDILILGKALTAGYLGHAATIASSKIYNSFLGNGYEKAFMHGPTFMGNPLACAIALKSIEIFEKNNYLIKIKKIEKIIKKEFSPINSIIVKEKRILGAIGAIELIDKKFLIGFQEFALNKSIWIRPIGSVIYIMPPYIIKKQQLIKIIEVIKLWISITDSKLKKSNKKLT